MRDVGLGDKVYSPDLQEYEASGNTGIFGTIASVLVAPVRICIRVTHNIYIMPAHLYREYATALASVCCVFSVLGLIDFVVYKRWPLLVSQVIVGLLSARYFTKAKAFVPPEDDLREVEINNEAVEDYCKTIFDKLDDGIGG